MEHEVTYDRGIPIKAFLNKELAIEELVKTYWESEDEVPLLESKKDIYIKGVYIGFIDVLDIEDWDDERDKIWNEGYYEGQEDGRFQESCERDWA